MDISNVKIKVLEQGRRTRLFATTNGDNWHMIGAFSKIQKINRNEYDFNGNCDKKLVTSIKATKEDSSRKSEREFELEVGLHTSIGEWIRTPGRVIGFSIENLDDIYYEFEDYIIKKVPIKDKHIVKAYGVFGKDGIIYTPDNFEIENVDLDKNHELKSFMEIFNGQPINENKLKKTINVLYNYLKNDQVNLLTFAYGFASLFRHYLFYNHKLEDFPFLGLMSSDTEKGKSARVRILINGAFLNWTTKSFHPASIINGSDERFHELNKIQAPIGFEEIDRLSSDKTSFLKQLATSSQMQTKISKSGGEGTYTRDFIRGGIVITANEMKEIHSTLRDRFILVDLNETKPYKGCNKDYDYLKDNIGIFSKHVWTNIKKYKEVLKMESTTRSKSYEQVLKNGMRLVNSMLESFGHEPLLLNIKDFLESKEDIIATDKTKKRNEIIKFIKLFTSYTDKDGYSKKTIFDIQSLMRNPRKNKKIIEKILSDAFDKGIVAGEEGIMITKDFLNEMKQESNNFTLIKNVHALNKFFLKDSFTHYRSGNNEYLNYYDSYYTTEDIPKGKFKTGIMLLNVWKDHDSVWEEV